MGCIFSAKGRDFDVDRFLRKAKFKPKGAWKFVDQREAFHLVMKRSRLKTIRVWHKGEPYWSRKPNGPQHKHSGFSLDVSKASFDNLRRPIQDAICFLKANKHVLGSLRRFLGVESRDLGFAVNRVRGAAVQWETFPIELLQKTGELDIELTLGFYPPDESGRKKTKPSTKKKRTRT
jgi:hypothetical protein